MTPLPMSHHSSQPPSNTSQVGGTHYIQHKMPHFFVVEDNRVPWCAACLLKYIFRHQRKNKFEDIMKARDYLRLWILYILGSTDEAELLNEILSPQRRMQECMCAENNVMLYADMRQQDSDLANLISDSNQFEALERHVIAHTFHLVSATYRTTRQADDILDKAEVIRRFRVLDALLMHVAVRDYPEETGRMLLSLLPSLQMSV